MTPFVAVLFSVKWRITDIYDRFSCYTFLYKCLIKSAYTQEDKSNAAYISIAGHEPFYII